ncbi:MAG: NAD(P)-dependent glycerol-1-phosphate dehydrogenase [Thaumarchaeota archaeon]|nr:NAD(P)-dependent glycerol-1-phosphate dehydrogenase [Nitrososphaerota archaeon]
MGLHAIELPRRILVGSGVISELSGFLEALGLDGRILIVTGSHVRNNMGSIVTNILTENQHTPVWMEVESATLAEVKRIQQAAAKEEVIAVVGLGGGKSVDVAKLAAHNIRRPLISVPTSASHDGISSPMASIKGMDRPYSMICSSPLGVLADIDLIVNAPARLLASGCGDLLAKITAVWDWRLAWEEKNEYYGEYAASLALLSARFVIRRANEIGKHNVDGVRGVVEALISAGVAAGIAGSSRPCSGGEHLFSHALSLIAPGAGLHGETCGIGAIMVSKLQGEDSTGITDALRKVNAPTTAKQIGVTPEQIAKALVMAPSIRPERYTILHRDGLDYDSALKLAKETGVI